MSKDDFCKIDTNIEIGKQYMADCVVVDCNTGYWFNFTINVLLHVTILFMILSAFFELVIADIITGALENEISHKDRFANQKSCSDLKSIHVNFCAADMHTVQSMVPSIQQKTLGALQERQCLASAATYNLVGDGGNGFASSNSSTFLPDPDDGSRFTTTVGRPLSARARMEQAQQQAHALLQQTANYK